MELDSDVTDDSSLLNENERITLVKEELESPALELRAHSHYHQTHVASPSADTIAQHNHVDGHSSVARKGSQYNLPISAPLLKPSRRDILQFTV
jgi:hypothetical protein